MNTTASSRHRRNISPFLADRHVRRFRFSRHSRGFTIVELLIVVVIIAILAAITLVTYSGLQQRSRNAAIIDAASKSIRLIQAYTAANGTYPYSGTGNACVTTTSGCVRDSGGVDNAVSTFDTNMATIGSLPRSVASSGSVAYGIIYNYLSTRTFNNATQPAIIIYYLEGTGQNCGLANVMNAWDIATTASSGYTSWNASASGKTMCFISIPGPTA